jgi:hypothetical protein
MSRRILGLGHPPEHQPGAGYTVDLGRPGVPDRDEDGLPEPPARSFFCRACEPPCATCPLDPKEGS